MLGFNSRVLQLLSCLLRGLEGFLRSFGESVQSHTIEIPSQGLR